MALSCPYCGFDAYDCKCDEDAMPKVRTVQEAMALRKEGHHSVAIVNVAGEVRSIISDGYDPEFEAEQKEHAALRDVASEAARYVSELDGCVTCNLDGHLHLPDRLRAALARLSFPARDEDEEGRVKCCTLTTLSTTRRTTHTRAPGSNRSAAPR